MGSLIPVRIILSEFCNHSGTIYCVPHAGTGEFPGKETDMQSTALRCSVMIRVDTVICDMWMCGWRLALI